MRIHAGLLVSSFDLFNVTDLDLIAQARQVCEYLTVAVLGDDAVLAATGWAPVAPLLGRQQLLQHVRGVDEVITAEHELERYGAALNTVVMVSPMADRLRGGDMVVVSGRRTDSQMLGQLNPFSHAPFVSDELAGGGVA